MASYRDQAVVLRTHKLGEADRIITMLTPNHGLVRAVAKGVRRTASKFGARLEPFSHIDVMCFQGRNLDTITQVESIALYAPALSGELSSYQAASIMVETAAQLTEVEASAHQFHLLAGGLKALAGGLAPTGLIRDSYLLRALALSGWALNYDSCVVCGSRADLAYFSVAHGGVLCANCHKPGAVAVTKEVMLLLRALSRGDWQQTVNATQGEANQAAAIVAAHVKWQLERGLKSYSTVMH